MAFNSKLISAVLPLHALLNRVHRRVVATGDVFFVAPLEMQLAYKEKLLARRSLTVDNLADFSWKYCLSVAGRHRFTAYQKLYEKHITAAAAAAAEAQLCNVAQNADPVSTSQGGGQW